jgi:hypothetical protein
MKKLLTAGLLLLTSVTTYASTTLVETADWLEKKTIELGKFSYSNSRDHYNDYKAIVFIDAKTCQADVLTRYKKDAPTVLNEFDDYVDYKSYEIITTFDLAKVNNVYASRRTVNLSSDLPIFKRARTTWYKTAKKQKSSNRNMNFSALNNSYAKRYTKALKHAVSLCTKDAVDEPF